MKITPVIMCGGVGSRLWPLSTKEKPKQFLKFFNNEESLLQCTVRRFLGRKDFSDFIFLTNALYVDILKEQLSEIEVTDFTIIAEPCSKNTAPALSLASLFIKHNRPNDLMIATPSDSYIADNDIFIDAVYTAKNYIEKNKSFILFGIDPTYPEEGFGYIKPILNSNNISIKKVEYFFEKPSKKNATKYIETGCLWNSGIVICNPSDFLQEMEKHNKSMATLCTNAYESSLYEKNLFYINAKYFEKVESISVDYALLELSSLSNVLHIVGSHWNDVGTWKAVYNLSKKDSNGNALIGNVKIANCYNCYVFSPDQLTVIVGLKNKIIVNVKDICLNMDMSESQNIKQILS